MKKYHMFCETEPLTPAERIAYIRAVASHDPAVRALIKQLDDSGARIVMADDLAWDPMLGGVRGQHFYQGRHTVSIRLNELVEDGELVSTLIHELRHFQQNVALNFSRLNLLSPLERVIFNRLIEGDANAYAARAVLHIRQATKLPLPSQLHGSVSPITLLKARVSDPAYICNAVFKNFQKEETRDYLEEFAYSYDRQEVINLHENGRKATGRIVDVFNDAASIFSYERNGRRRLYLQSKTLPELVAKVESHLPPALKRDLRAP